MATMTVAHEKGPRRFVEQTHSAPATFPSLSVHYESHDYAPSGPAGSRCDLGDLLLSFLLSLYDRFAAWASITAGAAEDPLWVDYCRLPD
jgi:hypothetical protein